MILNSVNGRYQIEGSFPELLNTLASTMNFTYTVEPPPDNAWGGLQDDGTWNGMINLVQNNIKDFGKKNIIHLSYYISIGKSVCPSVCMSITNQHRGIRKCC